MITTKQRAVLRGLANRLSPTMQIGKEGINENSITQITQMLNANELIKIKVLQNSDFTARGLAEQITKEIECEPVQVIGNTIVLYAYSHKEKIKHIELD